MDDSHWISLKKVMTSGSNLVKKDAANFMFIAKQTIHTYNIKENNWVHEKIKNNIQDHCSTSISYNPKSKIMFIANAKLFTIFNMESKQISQYPAIYEHGSIISIDNDECHSIGGDEYYNSNTHKVWNNETKEWENIHTFKEYSNGFDSFGLIYVSKRKELLLFGGYDYASDVNGHIDTIWKYCIPKQSWIRLNVKLPQKMNSFGCVITKNQQYIIIMGGFGNGEYHDEIFIFDLKVMKIRESKTKLPFKRYFGKAVIMENKEETDLCVHGFVRQAMNKYNINLPFALISLVGIWTLTEYIHIIQDGAWKEHWKINVDKIIDSN